MKSRAAARARFHRMVTIELSRVVDLRLIRLVQSVGYKSFLWVW